MPAGRYIFAMDGLYERSSKWNSSWLSTHTVRKLIRETDFIRLNAVQSQRLTKE
jgi:hypothetical protein